MCVRRRVPARTVDALKIEERSAVGLPILEMRDIHKRFGSTHALRGVSFDFKGGEAHALLGENGSGKSTLMKVASGEIEPSEGDLFLDGVKVSFGSPLQAARSGITMVAQEVPVVGAVTVAENIALGRLPRKATMIDWRQIHRTARAVLGELGAPLDSRRLVSSLRPDEKQIVAIARALAVDARVVIFDEPTSSLTSDRVESLFEIIQRMKERGIAIAFISQRLQDIEPVADRVTVIRDGVAVETLPISEADESTITRLMVGRSLNDYFHREVAHVQRPPADPVLILRDVSVGADVSGVSLELFPGEIVGIAGLVGSGRVEVVRAIFGLLAATGGIEVSGRPFDRRSPRRAIAAGLALVTGDRKGEGLVGSRSILQNLTMVKTNRLSLRHISHRQQRIDARRVIQEMHIRPPDPDRLVAKLSGGNQQKVSLGRWLIHPPKVFLLDEPTRGVDVGAKSEIYRVLRELAAGGTAVLISSSENSELLGICDRVLMMFQGKIVAEGVSDDLDEWKVAEHLAGTHKNH